MPLYGMHDQPERAQSFGAAAEDYDRYRLGYPQALADHLLEAGPRTALDIGCGTGKAAVLMANRGVAVLGLEPDARMAAVAETHGIPVEVARLEDWDPGGRRFDLITCASAWHWLQPEAAAKRIPELLNPGGLLARFWNYHVFEADVLEALDAVYADFPSAEPFGHDPSGDPEPPDPLEEVDTLRVLPSWTYRWTGVITSEEWTNRIGTYSGHQRLGPTALTELQSRVAGVIDGFGGSITSHFGTLCLQAIRR